MPQLPSLSEALFFHQCGRLAEANIMFRKVIQEEPNNHIALHSLGILMADEQNFVKAREMIEEAITLSPKTAHYYRSLGQICIEQKDYDQGKGAYRTSLMLEPLHTDSLEGLGQIAEIQEDYFNAIAYYREAQEAFPSCGRLQLCLARNLFAAGFLEECVKHYERAHVLQPYSLEVIVDYARVLLLSSRYIPCRRLLDYAADYFPCHPQLQYIHAQLYMKIECYDLAVCHFESALEHLTDDPQVLTAYAECLRLLGDDVSADRVVQQIDGLK